MAALKLLMCAVTIRRIFGVLASTESDLFLLCELENLRLKPRSLVATIAQIALAR